MQHFILVQIHDFGQPVYPSYAVKAAIMSQIVERYIEHENFILNDKFIIYLCYKKNGNKFGTEPQFDAI